MARPTKYSPEVRQRAVRMVRNTGQSIRRSGRPSRRSPRSWAARTRRSDAGFDRPSAIRVSAGLTADERRRLKELERENRELKRANEILMTASAYFAQAELDRRAEGWSGSSMIIGRSMGSSRSGRCSRTLHRRIFGTSRSRPIRRGARLGRETASGWRSFAASARIISRCTGRAKSGGKWPRRTPRRALRRASADAEMGLAGTVRGRAWVTTTQSPTADPAARLRPCQSLGVADRPIRSVAIP